MDNVPVEIVEAMEQLDTLHKNGKSQWEEFFDIPFDAVGFDPVVGLYASPKIVRDLMKEQGKTKKEICAALGVRHTDDVPYPVEHLRFGRRRRSRKVNKLA